MNNRKLRPILTVHPRADEPFHVHVENQDGSYANTGAAFTYEHQAQCFLDGVTLTLRTLDMLALPKKPVSEEAERRLRQLCQSWQHAKFSVEQEARAYGCTRPPGSALTDGARWKARRYRLALWAVGRLEDARTVTP